MGKASLDLKGSQKDFKDVSKSLLTIADWMKTSDAALKIKPGILDGKRTESFKGKAAFNALMRPSFQKCTKMSGLSEEEAVALLDQFLSLALITRVNPSTPLTLFTGSSSFDKEGHYVWIYEGSTLKTMLMGIAVLALIFAGVLFPLWPEFLRIGVYYLSMCALTLLGVLMLLILIRYHLTFFN